MSGNSGRDIKIISHIKHIMNKEPTPNPKCSNCKCYWKPDETDIKSSGLYCQTCKKCRERQNEKVECECGAIISRHRISRHMKTSNHQVDLKKKHSRIINGIRVYDLNNL